MTAEDVPSNFQPESVETAATPSFDPLFGSFSGLSLHSPLSSRSSRKRLHEETGNGVEGSDDNTQVEDGTEDGGDVHEPENTPTATVTRQTTNPIPPRDTPDPTLVAKGTNLRPDSSLIMAATSSSRSSLTGSIGQLITMDDDAPPERYEYEKPAWVDKAPRNLKHCYDLLGLKEKEGRALVRPVAPTVNAHIR
jgi:hypothetical protein